MSASTLSELLPVSRAAVSQYETDQRSPSPEVMGIICQALNFPQTFFCRDPRPETENPIFYRSLSSATKVSRMRANRRLGWMHDMADYVRAFVDLPLPNLPPVDHLADQPAMIDARDIERAASDLRRFWRLGDGPIDNIVWLVENNGLLVARTSLDTAKMDALSVCNEHDATPYILLNRDKGTACRWRFDVGHELGHMVLHRHMPRAVIEHPANHALIEKQASRFAAALLLPARSLIDDFHAATLDSLLVLKERWGVAVKAIITRCNELHIIREDTARRLYMNHSRRRWVVQEPLDDIMAPEQPALMRRSIEMLVEDGTCGSEEISTALPYSLRDLAELSNLPASFFGGRSAEVATLEPSATRRVMRPPNETIGTVVPIGRGRRQVDHH